MTWAHRWALYTATAYESNQPAGSVTPNPDPTDPRVQGWIGWFAACRSDQRGDRVDLDFVAPGGLFKAPHNKFETCTVHLLVEIEPIDENGYAVAGSTVIRHDVVLSAATNTPQRWTKKFAAATGRYRVRVRRTDDTDNLSSTVDKIQWTGLKFRVVDTSHERGTYQDFASVRTYGNVTLAAVKLRATNTVGGKSAQQIRFVVNRALQATPGAGAFVETRNPVDALKDVICAAYGGDRPYTDNEIDLAAFDHARTKFAAMNFDAVFDGETTVWEAAKATLQGVAATPLPLGSQVSIAHDSLKSSPVALFSENNIVAGSLAITYLFARVGDPEGVRVEYRDPVNFTADAISIPQYGTNVQTVNLFGSTSRDHARQYAQFVLNQQRHNGKSITFETEMEGFSVRYGDRIAVAHSLPNWGQSAIVVKVAGDTLTVDKPMYWGTGTHAVMLRDQFGAPHYVDGVTKGASASEIVLPRGHGFTPYAFGGTEDPTHLAFGETSRAVTDWVVSSVEPSQDFRVRITAVNYSPEVYDGAMPHQKVAE